MRRDRHVGIAKDLVNHSFTVRAAVSCLAALTVLALSPAARAASCCAGATVMPGRLMIHEDALVGLDLRAGRELGAFDDGSRFAESRGTEHALEEGLFAASRFFGRGQAAARLPLVQTHRDTGGLREIGGGLGDLQVEARWDFVDTGELLHLPGVALLASASLPTGRAPEEVENPLGTDVTGLGAFLASAGLALEHVEGSLLAGLSGSVGARAARTVRGERIPSSLIWSVAGTVGMLLPREAAVALAATYTKEPDALRSWLRLGLAGGMPLSDEWRIQGGLFGDPPLRGFGRNQPASVGATFVLIRSWS